MKNFKFYVLMALCQSFIVSEIHAYGAGAGRGGVGARGEGAHFRDEQALLNEEGGFEGGAVEVVPEVYPNYQLLNPNPFPGDAEQESIYERNQHR